VLTDPETRGLPVTTPIARALANRPRIILADEPTAHRAGIVMDLLRNVAVDQDAAIIAVTHDDKILDRLDEIFSLPDGLLEADTGGDPSRADGPDAGGRRMPAG